MIHCHDGVIPEEESKFGKTFFKNCWYGKIQKSPLRGFSLNRLMQLN